jgi:hypothetical protein
MTDGECSCGDDCAEFMEEGWQTVVPGIGTGRCAFCEIHGGADGTGWPGETSKRYRSGWSARSDESGEANASQGS